MTPESALYQLLLSLFGADEFRRWLRFDTEASIIVHDLPGPTASASDLVCKAVDRLVEHGLVNHSFFVRLRDARPRRAADIDQVAVLWPSTTTGVSRAGESASHETVAVSAPGRQVGVGLGEGADRNQPAETHPRA